MNIRLFFDPVKASLLTTGSSTALVTAAWALSATGAWAQSVTDSPVAAGEESAAAEDDTVIVVTAQKRDERLIDTPISIGVLSGEDLDQSNARGVADVLNEVGGVSLSQNAPGRLQIA